MTKCEWCGKKVKSLNVVNDAFEDTVSNICDDCKKKLEAHECIKCGSKQGIIIRGMCTKCYQSVMYEKQVKKEEVLSGLSSVDDEGITSSSMEFTDDEYEKWMSMGKTYSHKDIKESAELRRIWIMVKLAAVGITDKDVIDSHIEIIEELIDRCFSKLVNNKCRLIIVQDSETRKIARRAEVIDYIDDVFILKA